MFQKSVLTKTGTGRKGRQHKDLYEIRWESRGESDGKTAVDFQIFVWLWIITKEADAATDLERQYYHQCGALKGQNGFVVTWLYYSREQKEKIESAGDVGEFPESGLDQN